MGLVTDLMKGMPASSDPWSSFSEGNYSGSVLSKSLLDMVTGDVAGSGGHYEGDNWVDSPQQKTQAMSPDKRYQITRTGVPVGWSGGENSSPIYGNNYIVNKIGNGAGEPYWVYGPEGQFLRTEAGAKNMSYAQGILTVAGAALGFNAIGAAAGGAAAGAGAGAAEAGAVEAAGAGAEAGVGAGALETVSEGFGPAYEEWAAGQVAAQAAPVETVSEGFGPAYEQRVAALQATQGPAETASEGFGQTYENSVKSGTVGTGATKGGAEALGLSVAKDKLVGSLVSAGASSILGSIFSPKANMAAPTVATPLERTADTKTKAVSEMPDPLAQQRARKRSLVEQMGRRGRASTILTSPSGRLGS